MFDDKNDDNRNNHENNPTNPPPRGLHRKFLNRHVLSGLMVGDGTWRSVMLDDKSDDNRNDHEIHLIDENDDALKGVLGFGW